MIDENLKIVNFEFRQICYSGIDDRYVLIGNGTDYELFYFGRYTCCHKIMSKIKNFEEFNKGILSIIKNWKRKYYPKYDICDGLCWELNLKLSNGKYVYYRGHHETPENYDDLLNFLEKYFK